MIKQFLIKNWFWVAIIGVMAILYLEESKESSDKDKIIDNVIEKHEEDKRELSNSISSLSFIIDSMYVEVDSIDIRYAKIEEKLKIIQNERIEVNRNVPSYSDTKLDSVLSNHRHR